MATPAERRAIGAGVLILALGIVWRAGARDSRPAGTTRADSSALSAQIAAVAGARSASRKSPDRSRRRKSSARPSSAAPQTPASRGAPPVLRPDTASAPSPINVDEASAEELVRLPFVGPALAARIVAVRDSCGAFGSLKELDRVRGIGPSLLKRLEPLVRFSGGGGHCAKVTPTPTRPSKARASRRRAAKGPSSGPPNGDLPGVDASLRCGSRSSRAAVPGRRLFRYLPLWSRRVAVLTRQLADPFSSRHRRMGTNVAAVPESISEQLIR